MKRYTVSIKQVDWIDKEGLEAEVLFEVNGKTFWAFCNPCDFIEGEIAKVYISFIEEEILEDIFWEENKGQRKEILQSKDERLRYYFYGQLKSINPVMIDCGALTLAFGEWINDETAIGSYVYFVVSRLDINRM